MMGGLQFCLCLFRRAPFILSPGSFRDLPASPLLIPEPTNWRVCGLPLTPEPTILTTVVYHNLPLRNVRVCVSVSSHWCLTIFGTPKKSCHQWAIVENGNRCLRVYVKFVCPWGGYLDHSAVQIFRTFQIYTQDADPTATPFTSNILECSSSMKGQMPAGILLLNITRFYLPVRTCKTHEWQKSKEQNISNNTICQNSSL